MHDLTELLPLKQVIARHQLQAKKSLGQHFLLDSRITDRIARTSGDLLEANIIEIGPGPGGLTRSLLKIGAKKVVAVEKDARCITALHEIKDIVGHRLEIIEADALELDLTKHVPPPRKVVANLPYNIGTKLLLNWLDVIHAQGPGAFQSLTLMFQKEVAERIAAEPNGKDYGRLSVLSQWLCDVRYDFELSPGSFSPPPKVQSAVVTLIPRDKPLVAVSKEAVETVMAAAFGKRRKMLRGALASLGVNTEALLAEAGVMGTARAEQLDVVTLCNLARAYQRFFIKSAKPT